MRNLIYGHRFKLAKRCEIAVLILAHLLVITPLPEVKAMESANYRINERAFSSGGGKDSGTNAEIAYSNIGEPAVGNIESSNYKISLGYINTIASNPPVLNSLIPNADMRVVWNKGSANNDVFNLDDYFLSPDDSPLTYIVEGNRNIGVDINAASHTVSFSQSPDFYGSESVKFIAIDENGNRTKSNFVILVVKAPINNAPIIYPIEKVIANENELVEVIPEVFDPDGDMLDMTFTAPLDDNGQWQTTFDDAGVYTAKVTISDGGLSDSEDINIEVRNVNRAPFIEPVADMSIEEGAFIKLNILTYDPDGDNVTVHYPEPFDADGRWQTTYKDAGDHNIVVRASDGDLNSAESFNIHVDDKNASPSVRISSNRDNLEPHQPFTIYVLGQDPDGDSLKLTLKKDGTVVPDCENVLLEGGVFARSFSISDAGEHTFEALVEEVGVIGTPNTASGYLTLNVEEASAPDQYFPISGDFNGDGLTDIGYYNRALGIWKVALSRNGGFGAFEYWINESDDFGKNSRWFYPLTGDFNGDGKTDVGFIRVPTSDGAGSYIDIAISNSAGFDIHIPPTNHWRDSQDGKSLRSSWYYTTFAGDFNGDGFTDIGQINTQDHRQRFTGLTEEDLGMADLEDWFDDTVSHVSISDFSPLAGDFNGDGLTDLCLFKKNSAGRWVVSLSRGDKLGVTEEWITGFGSDKDAILGDFNYDGLTDIGYTYKENGQWNIKYAVSDGTKFVESEATYQTDISEGVNGTFITGDFNGDGIFDIGCFDKDSRKWIVRLHVAKYPDLLIEIDNSIGGKIKIEYKDSAIFDNTGDDDIPDLPFSMRVVSKVVQEDGMGHSYGSRYFYSRGFFASGKREFRGFGYVKVTDAEGHYKETEFYQDDVRKGRPRHELVKDKYGMLYGETRYRWHYSGTDDEPEYRMAWGGLVPFPTLEEKESIIYSPHDNSDYKSTKLEYDYDAYGNPSEIKEYGFTGDVLKKTSISYTLPNTTAWIIGKPKVSTIYEGDGVARKAETRYYYDNLDLGASPIKGNLTGEEKWLDYPVPRYIATNFEYYPEGNIKKVTDALGHITATTYDTTKTFQLSMSNHLGHTQEFEYDKASGKILTSTDPNGQVTTSTYDGFGRPETVIGPGNISEVNYEYDLSTFPAKTVTTVVAAKDAAGATTESHTSYGFIDGLGRQILSRTQADYRGDPKHIVTGETEYDLRGQVVKKYLPYYIDVPDPEDDYLPASNSTPYVSYEYDAMGRLVKTIRPDKKVSCIIYDLNEVVAIDEGNAKTRQVKDEYGRIIEIEEDGGYVTNYEYDTLGNLTDTYDSVRPTPNHTHIEYDSLGRKISMDDPDMHYWEYGYDDAGNLIWQKDANGQILEFEYDEINRLTSKIHSGSGASEGGGSSGVESVRYTYDTITLQNPYAKGRLTKVTDQSGTTEFFYDRLGREIKTTKTIHATSYTVERTYDSLDRLTTVKYPDNSIVTYDYNKQGGIEKVGTPDDDDLYVRDTTYNANGQITHIEYGNRVVSNYAYDPDNLRLRSLATYKMRIQFGSGFGASFPDYFQTLSYTFDPVGNVKSIIDHVNTNTQYFSYDNLNRLTQATGASYGRIDYEYDSIGNMLKKGDITMEYGQDAGPHAVTSYTPGGAVSYDPNGNMIRKGDDLFEYDIENRLTKAISEKGGRAFDISIDFDTGWNFFSIPGFVPNAGGKISDVLSSIDGKYTQVSKYDTTKGEWLHFVGNDKFDQFETIEYGEGYLIYVAQSCALNVKGLFPVSKKTRDLKAGWNLIGAPTDTSMSTEEALGDLSYDAIKIHNGSGYNDAMALEAGKAYLVHLNADQTWNIPLPKVETTYAYDGDGGRVLRNTSHGFSTLYIGSAFEAEGPSGGQATKHINHIFMGSTRVCSVETEFEVVNDDTDTSTSTQTSSETSTTTETSTNTSTSTSTSTSTIVSTSHTYYYHQDHIGSSNVITDENGEVVNILEYTPYGLVSRNTGNYSTDKRFTGKTYDESTTLYYYGARYYDPQLGRFITADPTIQRPYDPQDLNRYAYCRNNPIKYVDPTGYSWWDEIKKWFGKIIGGIAGIFTTIITGGNVGLGLAVFNVIDTTFSVYQATNNLGLAFGVGLGSMVAGHLAGGFTDLLFTELIGKEIANQAIGSFTSELLGSAVGGAVSSGITSLGAGEDFGEGFASGAASGAAWYTTLRIFEAPVNHLKKQIRQASFGIKKSVDTLVMKAYRGGDVDLPVTMSGHAWVESGDGSTSLGTWPNKNPSNNSNLHLNREVGWDVKVAKVSISLTTDQVSSLVKTVSKGLNWTHLNNCSSGAVNLWRSAGGGVISNRSMLGIPTVRALADSIERGYGY